MRSVGVWLVAIGLSVAAMAQTAHAAQPADLFDFWLGDWRVSWHNADGTTGSARNRIIKTLDGKVIEENFEQDASDLPPILRGRSVSVLQQSTGIWQQVWADNQGGYFAFSASVDGDKRIFATALLPGADNIVRGQRMVFYNIQANSFAWDWEGTRDGGRSWSLLWRLAYFRQ